MHPTPAPTRSRSAAARIAVVVALLAALLAVPAAPASAAPAPPSHPPIVLGDPIVGETLTLAGNAGWGPDAVSIHPTWVGCLGAVPDWDTCMDLGMHPALLLTEGMEGRYVGILEVAYDLDSEPSYSWNLQLVESADDDDPPAGGPAAPATPPSVTGTPRPGQMLTYEPGTWGPDAVSVIHVWVACLTSTPDLDSCTTLSPPDPDRYVPASAAGGAWVGVVEIGVDLDGHETMAASVLVQIESIPGLWPSGSPAACEEVTFNFEVHFVDQAGDPVPGVEGRVLDTPCEFGMLGAGVDHASWPAWHPVATGADGIATLVGFTTAVWPLGDTPDRLLHGAFWPEINGDVLLGMGFSSYEVTYVSATDFADLDPGATVVMHVTLFAPEPTPPPAVPAVPEPPATPVPDPTPDPDPEPVPAPEPTPNSEPDSPHVTAEPRFAG